MRASLKVLLIAVLLVLLALPLFAGGGTETAAKEFEIVTVVKIAGIPWFNRLEEGVKQADQELGVNAYLLGPADADLAQQVKSRLAAAIASDTLFSAAWSASAASFLAD